MAGNQAAGTTRPTDPTPQGPLVLGLDLGPNSVGWALVSAALDTEGDVTSERGIVAAGVRVFEAGLENYGSSKEQSRNQARRQARSVRRVGQRRAQRRRALKAILQEGGLLPRDVETLRAYLGPFAPGDRSRDPYALRTRSLDGPLEPFELGVAIYHLAKRRGFRSNRKERTKAKDTGPVLGEIGSLEQAMRATGARTLGEYLHRLGKHDPAVHAQEAARQVPTHRLRGRHISRMMIQSEFTLIWACQRQYRPALLTDALARKILETTFHQRPYQVTIERVEALHKRKDGRPRFANMRRSPSVAKCCVERDEYCMWRGHWLAQRFRLLKEVNSLRIQLPDGVTRALGGGERTAILKHLEGAKEAKFSKLRDVVAKQDVTLDPDAFQFNLERGSRKALAGNSVEYALVTAFTKSGWAKFSDARRDELRMGLSELEFSAESDDGHAEALGQLLKEDGARVVKRAQSSISRCPTWRF